MHHGVLVPLTDEPAFSALSVQDQPLPLKEHQVIGHVLPMYLLQLTAGVGSPATWHSSLDGCPATAWTPYGVLLDIQEGGTAM